MVIYFLYNYRVASIGIPFCIPPPMMMIREEEPEDRVEVVNLVFAPEAVEESDGTPIKIFPASELEKLKVTLADRALFFTNYQFSFISL